MTDMTPKQTLRRTFSREWNDLNLTKSDDNKVMRAFTEKEYFALRQALTAPRVPDRQAMGEGGE